MAKLKLNEQQLQAVRYISGPCLVLAGAGSGKTRVITEKIVHLIKNCSYNAYNICAVTFTNKAAREMKERIALEFQSSEIQGLRVATFHSLCLEILREEHEHIGLKKNFVIFDEYDQLALIKEILGEMDISLTSELINEEARNTLNRISHYKNDLIMPDDVYYLNLKDKQEFGMLYEKYDNILQLYNAVDFDDLILKVIVLFKKHANILAKWQGRIRYLLVDEYQDTNTAQYELIKLLVKSHEHFTVVGDDDQSIYSWRGARPENINILSQDFPLLKVIKLEQNYRSKGRILKCANALIAHNDHLFLKNLYSEHGLGHYIRIITGENPSDEARKVVVDLMGTRVEKAAKYTDYAILYRSNYQSREIEEQLIRAKIPYKVIGGTSFFAQQEIKDMMNYLRLIAYGDNSAFLQVINLPPRGIGPKTLESFTKYAAEQNLNYFEATTDYSIFSALSNKDSDKFYTFGQQIEDIRERVNGDNGLDEISKIVEYVGYKDWIIEHSTNLKVATKILDNIQILCDWVKKSMEGDVKNLEKPKTFEEAIDRLSLREMLDRNEQEDELDEVTLITLHSSKGLEFKYVYLIGMEEGILPHSKTLEENGEDVSEERRLAYVGITRAREELTISYAKTRPARDLTTNKLCNKKVKPSRFIDELPREELLIDGEKTEDQEIAEEEKKFNIISNLDSMFNNYKP